MKKRSLIVLMLTLLVGCAPPKQIETLGIVSSYGADLLHEDKALDNTFLYKQFDPDIPEAIQAVESQANTYEGALDTANLKTNYKLVTGQIRVKVFGKELAETGIMRVLSPHFKNAEEPASLYLLVSETTAREVLTIDTSIDLSKYLYNLIDNNQKREILPESDFFDFVHKYEDIGIDPIQPLVTIEKQKPVIESIALFQNDVYVDSLSPKQTFLVKLMTESFKAGKQEMSLSKQPFEEFIEEDEDKHKDEEFHFVLSEIRSKSKILLNDKKNLSYDVNISLDARLMELSVPLLIKDEKVLKKLEKQIEDNFKEQLQEVMDKTKELNVDPMGFGTTYNQETRNNELTEEKWREMYPNIDVNFNIDVNIIRHGIFD
ncbi:Ger(x)C family spore germination protein [Aquibacillus rhizosphaerae]|uniref:Ger(X)C family spore germination protein n=1 Tax=Aquibacillus rhizosphaerae TaxID=3051431 RepID=A0ABT7L3I2_9BACI|nr:Ger(x)C family spore germination protein [Aquibacillus sp. LR5S19]MDL4840418.1 Ger(x)C family spore germination protein [Aquibacillus sp. LR5S19]